MISSVGPTSAFSSNASRNQSIKKLKKISLDTIWIIYINGLMSLTQEAGCSGSLCISWKREELDVVPKEGLIACMFLSKIF